VCVGGGRVYAEVRISVARPTPVIMMWGAWAVVGVVMVVAKVVVKVLLVGRGSAAGGFSLSLSLSHCILRDVRGLQAS
jgi:hypothetical protein